MLLPPCTHTETNTYAQTKHTQKPHMVQRPNPQNDANLSHGGGPLGAAVQGQHETQPQRWQGGGQEGRQEQAAGVGPQPATDGALAEQGTGSGHACG